MVELNIKLGGAAGQGLQSAGLLLGKMFTRGGYCVFAVQDNMSRIRGGHNFFQLRIRDMETAAMTRGVDILVAMDAESLAMHLEELNPGGVVLVDKEALKIDLDDPRILDLPMKKTAVAQGGKPLHANTVALGCVAGLVGYDPELLYRLLRETFGEAGAAVNIAAAKAGFDTAKAVFGKRFSMRIAPLENPKKRMFLNGNEAIALGALAADCRYMSAYPMSPSTSIIMYLSEVEKHCGMVTDQAEDEIAAVNAAFGAAMAGVRSMTATSGGGMALMAEAVSLSGAAEVPLVIIDCQRPGPATGLPTRTDQSDLLFAVHAGHGEFTKAVLAPGNAREAFYDTVLAFNLADEFQIPVIVLAEQTLSESYYTVEPFDLTRVSRNTSMLSDEEAASLTEYKRYALTDTGISPRLYPGQSRHLVLTDSHEHDETGHITEDGNLHARMVNKRLKRAEAVVSRFESPSITGKRNAKTMVVGWGTAKEALKEAVESLAASGEDVAFCYFHHLWPFPADASKSALSHNPRLIAVEGNGTGQLASLLSQALCRNDIARISKIDGRPMLADEIRSEIEKAVKQ